MQICNSREFKEKTIITSVPVPGRLVAGEAPTASSIVIVTVPVAPEHNKVIINQCYHVS